MTALFGLGPHAVDHSGLKRFPLSWSRIIENPSSSARKNSRGRHTNRLSPSASPASPCARSPGRRP